MSRYPGKLERALNDSFDYERKLKARIAELEAQVAELKEDVRATHESATMHAQLRIKAEAQVAERDRVIEALAKEAQAIGNAPYSGKRSTVQEWIEWAQAKANEDV